ncbi:MAG: dTMP kinase [Spirochaetales bacterium]
MILERFIVFEGLDGAGTTTQARLLADSLTADGSRIDLDCEPTGGPIGTLIRSVLRGEQSINPCSLAYLFAADRHEHVHAAGTGILSRLEQGYTIISDRYVYSSLAYQGTSCSDTLVSELNQRFPHPARVFYLDVPVNMCLERIAERGHTEIFEKEQFLNGVASRYKSVLNEAESKGVQVHRLDGTASTEKIAAEISSIVADSPITPM